MEWADKLGDMIPVEKKDFRMYVNNFQRVVAIICDSMCNNALEQFLMFKFSKKGQEVKKLFSIERDGPLASLINKARLAYAINLINEATLNDLINIHKIRNRCAHEIHISFGDKEICKYVRKLSVVPKDKKVTPANSLKFFMEAVLSSHGSFRI